MAAGGVCAPLSVVFLDEIDQGGVHLFGMRGTQEVLPVLDRDQLRIGRVLEQLDFSFRVGDGVYGVVRSLHVVSVRDSSPPLPFSGEMLTCSHMTGHWTSNNLPSRPSRSLKLIAAILTLLLPSSPW